MQLLREFKEKLAPSQPRVVADLNRSFILIIMLSLTKLPQTEQPVSAVRERSEPRSFRSSVDAAAELEAISANPEA